jgi:pimeloyl-ACP methyl ester carboxylesterase
VRRGEGGPAVVLVHGTMGSVDDWAAVLPLLSTSCSVVAYDRRGRGASGDGDAGAPYAIEREVEDVAAVVASVARPVTLVGHSFGAVVALLAAASGSVADRVVLYEPPVGPGTAPSLGWLDELDAAIAAGDRDAAVERFSRATGATDDELETVRRNERAWAALREQVTTVSREVRAASAVLPLDPAVVQRVVVPTLVLTGADQDAATYDGLPALARALPDGQLGPVPGRHLANVLAPEAFADAVRSFVGA